MLFYHKDYISKVRCCALSSEKKVAASSKSLFTGDLMKLWKGPPTSDSLNEMKAVGSCNRVLCLSHLVSSQSIQATKEVFVQVC